MEEETKSSDDEKDDQENNSEAKTLFRMSDSELLEACGGMTAHK